MRLTRPGTNVGWAAFSLSDKTKEKTGFSRGSTVARRGAAVLRPYEVRPRTSQRVEVKGYVLGLAVVLLGCLAITLSAILS